jgi:hypothetical protein
LNGDTEQSEVATTFEQRHIECLQRNWSVRYATLVPHHACGPQFDYSRELAALLRSPRSHAPDGVTLRATTSSEQWNRRIRYHFTERLVFRGRIKQVKRCMRAPGKAPDDIFGTRRL